MMRGGFNLTAPLGSGISFSAINCSGSNYSLTLTSDTDYRSMVSIRTITKHKSLNKQITSGQNIDVDNLMELPFIRENTCIEYKV